MSEAKVFKLTGIACQSQLISCSSVEPDAWVSFADHCEEVNALKAEVERLKANLQTEQNTGWDMMLENASHREKLEGFRNVVDILNKHIDKLTHAGNRLSIRTGQFGCAKNYQTELKDWAEVVSPTTPEEGKSDA